MKYYLQGFVNQLKYEMVEVRTDNINLSHIVKKGSMKKHLHALAAQIFEICTQHDILLNTTWIPRRLNRYADDLNKLTNTDNWSMDGITFEFLCQELSRCPQE